MTTVINGRGAWTKVGMPANGTAYYQLLSPVTVGSQPELGLSYQAVNYGVKAIQTRTNELGFSPRLATDGDFGPKTNAGLVWAQRKLGVAADGQFGPATSLAFFWPVIKKVAGANASIIGAICHLESGFDPGAVGYAVPNDLGIAQINQQANPAVTEAQMFDYHFAFNYLAVRTANALIAFKNRDAAICSYNSPEWAQEWQATGKAPNATAQEYVNLVLAWKPPS